MIDAKKIRPISGNAIVDPQAAMLEELGRLAPLQLTLQPIQVLVLLSHIQLAARHPLNTGSCRELAREIAECLQAYLQGPTLETVAALGWDSAFDVFPGRDGQ